MPNLTYKKYDAIMLDLDGVLVHYDDEEFYAESEKMIQRLANSPDIVRTFGDDQAKRLEAARNRFDSVIKVEIDDVVKTPIICGGSLSGEVARRLGPDSSVTADEFIDDFLMPASLRPDYTLIDEISEWSKRENIPVFLTTNNGNRRMDYLLNEGAGLDGKFAGIAASGNLHARKPQPEFYQRATDFVRQMTGKAPENLLLIDDSQYAIDGARAFSEASERIAGCRWDTLHVPGGQEPVRRSVREFLGKYSLLKTLLGPGVWDGARYLPGSAPA